MKDQYEVEECNNVFSATPLFLSTHKHFLFIGASLSEPHIDV